jgi:hypothetical protein
MLKEAGAGFLSGNAALTSVELKLPKLKEAGDWFLYNNDALTSVELKWLLCKVSG